MTSIPATEAKNRFGELLETVHREPVEISKKGRAVAVILSVRDFETMRVSALAGAHKGFSGIQAWVSGHKHIRTGKPLNEEDYHSHLIERHGK